MQFISAYPGDPTTPGYPAYENANRTEGTNIPKIPSLPISWQNAARLLKEIGDIHQEGSGGDDRELSGKVSKARIRLVNHGDSIWSVSSIKATLILFLCGAVDTKITPVWNVMASIPGYIRNEVVVIGCHRDGTSSSL